MDCFASLAMTLRGPSAHFEPASWGRSCRLSHGEARAGAAAILSQPPADLVPVALIELGRVGFLRRLAHAGVQRMGVVADQDAPALGLDAVEDDLCRRRRR